MAFSITSNQFATNCCHCCCGGGVLYILYIFEWMILLKSSMRGREIWAIKYFDKYFVLSYWLWLSFLNATLPFQWFQVSNLGPGSWYLWDQHVNWICCHLRFVTWVDLMQRFLVFLVGKPKLTWINCSFSHFVLKNVFFSHKLIFNYFHSSNNTLGSQPWC